MTSVSLTEFDDAYLNVVVPVKLICFQGNPNECNPNNYRDNIVSGQPKRVVLKDDETESDGKPVTGNPTRPRGLGLTRPIKCSRQDISTSNGVLLQTKDNLLMTVASMSMPGLSRAPLQCQSELSSIRDTQCSCRRSENYSIYFRSQ